MNDQELSKFIQQSLPPAPLGDDASIEALLAAQANNPAYGQGMVAHAHQPTKPNSSNRYLAIAAVLFLAAIPLGLIAIAKLASSDQATIAANQPSQIIDGLVEISPDFPEPAFYGTPLDIRVPNLEPAKSPRLNFTAPKGTHLISTDATVTSSEPSPLIGKLAMITDGTKTGDDGHFVELPPGHQWIQIDLGKTYNIVAITLWHYHKRMRAYRDVVIQASPDESFSSGSTIVYNNDHDNSLGFGTGSDPAYIETNHGRIIDVPSINARYIRLHSNGNSTDELNHYTEVEVYGQ